MGSPPLFTFRAQTSTRQVESRCTDWKACWGLLRVAEKWPTVFLLVLLLSVKVSNTKDVMREEEAQSRAWRVCVWDYCEEIAAGPGTDGTP